MDLPRYHTCASPPTCRIYVHPFRNSFGLIDLCRLSQDTRLTSDSCSSGWCFAIGFLHRGRFLPRLAELLVLPLFGRTADFHRIDTRALLGAQKKSRLEKSRRDRMVVPATGIEPVPQPSEGCMISISPRGEICHYNGIPTNLNRCRIHLNSPINSRRCIESCLPLPEKAVKRSATVRLNKQLSTLNIH